MYTNIYYILHKVKLQSQLILLSPIITPSGEAFEIRSADLHSDTITKSETKVPTHNFGLSATKVDTWKNLCFPVQNSGPAAQF